jgi:cell fate (sporulation/competence/biofilm development) regulator YmcA (YheA/YmcA/DUF963 family)
MKTDVSIEILETAKLMRRKIAKMIEVKCFAGVEEDIPELLEIIDYIDKRLVLYKKKYINLKKKENG